MSEVICIYYPIGGLDDTLNGCGLPIQHGQEIETILNLTTKQKEEETRLINRFIYLYKPSIHLYTKANNSINFDYFFYST